MLLSVILSTASVSDAKATADGTVTDRAGVVLNLHRVVLLGFLMGFGWLEVLLCLFGFHARPSDSNKSPVLLNLPLLFYSQNLQLESTEDLSDVLVKKGD